MLTWSEMLRLFGSPRRRTLRKKGKPGCLEAPPAAGAEPPAGTGDHGSPFSPEELRAINDEISQSLPADTPTETMLALVDIDPSHVHVYWQVLRADLEAAQRFAGVVKDVSETLVLKVHDTLCVTMTGFIPWPPLELEVVGLNGSRYLEVPDSGHTLIAELGLCGPDGVFVPLVWSRPVRMPRLDEATIPECVDLVVVDEEGNPPRVVGVRCLSSTEHPVGPPSVSTGGAGSHSVREGPVSSRDLHKGAWSGQRQSVCSDDDQA